MKSYKYTEGDLYIINHSIGVRRIKDGMVSDEKLHDIYWKIQEKIKGFCEWTNTDDMGYLTINFRDYDVKKYITIVLKILNESRILSCQENQTNG